MVSLPPNRLSKWPGWFLGVLRLAEMARLRKDYAKAEQRIRSLLAEFKDDKALVGRGNSALVRLYEEQGRMHELKLGN